MDFFFNDIYPNQGFYNTRSQTIPEADDKQALAEDKEASVKAKVNPKQKNHIFIALAVLVVLTVVLGVFK